MQCGSAPATDVEAFGWPIPTTPRAGHVCHSEMIRFAMTIFGSFTRRSGPRPMPILRGYWIGVLGQWVLAKVNGLGILLALLEP